MKRGEVWWVNFDPSLSLSFASKVNELLSFTPGFSPVIGTRNSSGTVLTVYGFLLVRCANKAKSVASRAGLKTVETVPEAPG